MKNAKLKLISFILLLSLLFTFNLKTTYAGTGEVLDGSLTGVGIVVNVLETLLPLIAKATEDSAINNGDYIELLSYIPSDFSQDRIYISAYDGINPKDSTSTWRIKIYPENNPNNPTEVTLKSGQQYSIRTDFQTPNVIFEFYNGSETLPYERFYLPFDKQNLNYAIALGCNKKTYYLQKESGRVFNGFVMRKLFGCTFSSRYEGVYDALSSDDKNKYTPIIFQKTKKVEKSIMSNSSYVDNQSIMNLLNQWKSPSHVYTPRPAPVVSFPYILEAENYIENSQFAQLIDLWNARELSLGVNGDYALYKVFIPDTGYYLTSYKHVRWDYPSTVELSEADTGTVYDTTTLTANGGVNYGLGYSGSTMVWLTKGMHILKLKRISGSETIIDHICFTQLNFSEEFDTGVTSWNAGKGNPSTAIPNGFYKSTSYNLDQDMDVIYKTFTSPRRNKVTMYIYDDAAKLSCHAMGNVSNGWNDGNTFVAMGVDGNKSTTKYVVRVGANSYITNIPRTTGFHKFKWDYQSTVGVLLYIDDILVRTDTSVQNYNSISLGDWWGDTIISNGIFFDRVDLDY